MSPEVTAVVTTLKFWGMSVFVLCLVIYAWRSYRKPIVHVTPEQARKHREDSMMRVVIEMDRYRQQRNDSLKRGA